MNTAVKKKAHDEMTTEELFQEYAESHCQELKWEIAMRYTGLIKSIALQLRGVYCSFTQLDDIISEGIIALADAVDKYDPERGKFDTYVAKRIRGLIIDLARRQDWVPRTVRKRAKEIERTTAELYGTLGRSPLDQEVAESLGMAEKDYQEALAQSSMYSIISLEELFERYDQWPGRSANMSVPVAPEQALQSDELLSALAHAIESLKENEQMVLSLYYQKNLKMKDIAVVLGVSAPRVSQIHAKALQKLKVLMTQYYNET